MVWVPPLVDHLYLQTGKPHRPVKAEKEELTVTDLARSRRKTRILRADSSQDLEPLSTDDGPNPYSKTQEYAHAALRDDYETESIAEAATQPNESPLQPTRAGYVRNST